MANWKSANEKFPAWEYEKNKVIEGVLIDKKIGIPVNGKDLNFYTIETDKGTFSILGTTVLNNTLGKYKIGTMVRITYKGMGKTKTGGEYKDFSVEYDADSMNIEDTFDQNDEDIPFGA